MILLLLQPNRQFAQRGRAATKRFCFVNVDVDVNVNEISVYDHVHVYVHALA
jgi:hypothetical protein